MVIQFCHLSTVTRGNVDIFKSTELDVVVLCAIISDEIHASSKI